ncbi:hypothetical protein IPZ68_32330 [Streptomyces arenae]|nr:hypothetical protein [Streptomyces arenae]
MNPPWLWINGAAHPAGRYATWPAEQRMCALLAWDAPPGAGRTGTTREPDCRV